MMMTFLVNLPLIIITIFAFLVAIIIIAHDSAPLEKKLHTRKVKHKHAH
jgi:hypothetical protein